MSSSSSLPLFAGYGIELEYMIVNRNTLDVLPVADQVLAAVCGEVVNEVEQGPLRWSNELVIHVIELKTNGPASALEGLSDHFTGDVRRINALLAPLGGCLMPTAMHPWMDPHRETRLWPFENGPIYRAYDRIFDCRGHGWANLQSTHINLPFADDTEFGQLHAAIRVALPLLPALAAASPLLDGRPGPFLDNRLDFYRRNQRRIPSVTGRVIPEPVFSEAAYQEVILHPMYRQIAPFDPEGVLQEEWLNSRGAIARFDRGAIEIRLLDVQECPRADLAIAAAVVVLLKALIAERWVSMVELQRFPIEPLERIFLDALKDGQDAVIADAAYLRTFGFPGASVSAGEFWCHLVEDLFADHEATSEFLPALQLILRHGPLARRILGAVGEKPDRALLRETYRSLCACLGEGEMFLG